jgi:hypothetical protein
MEALDNWFVAVHDLDLDGPFDYGNIYIRPRQVLEVVSFARITSIRMAALHKSSHSSRSGCQKVHHRVGICQASYLVDDGPHSYYKQLGPKRDGFCESNGQNSNQYTYLISWLQEDINLLALSLLPHQRQQPQGLPLKAVYRETVVGIRYLHSRDTTTAPVCEGFANAYQHCMH